jgi:NAD(P)-dependent dehydrogenase (short-subunit alcohol dehydrogenase family)
MQPRKTAILITGALGGLGTALTGMALKLPELDLVIATDVRSEIEQIYKDHLKVIGLQMDVSSEASIRNVCNRLHDKGISVKHIVNNAGISLFFPVSESTEDLLDKIVKVNTYGPILTVSVFLDDLVKNRGRVVQVSSDSVRMSTLFQPYPDTKIALEAFSNSMRQELKLLGVKLILIRPGAINTNLVEEMKSVVNPNENSKFGKQFDVFMERARKEVGRMSDPKDVAYLVRKAIMAGNPKRIYGINKNRMISMLAYFPNSWIDFFISKALRE